MTAAPPRYYPLQNLTHPQARHQILPHSHQPFLQMVSASPEMEAFIRDAVLTARSRERSLTKPDDILVLCRVLHRILWRSTTSQTPGAVIVGCGCGNGEDLKGMHVCGVCMCMCKCMCKCVCMRNVTWSHWWPVDRASKDVKKGQDTIFPCG